MKLSLRQTKTITFFVIGVLSFFAEAKFDQKGPQGGGKRTINEENTEAIVAYTNGKTGADAGTERLAYRIAELEKVLANQPKQASNVDREQAEYAKERAIKKIKKMECPKPDPIFGEDEEDMGGFGGGPSMAGGPGMESAPPMTQQMRDEIEDAMEEKMAKCKKKSQRQQMQTTGGMQNGMMGMQNGMMGMQNGMMGMGGLQGMLNPWMSMMSAGSMYGGANSQYSQFLPSYMPMNGVSNAYFGIQ